MVTPSVKKACDACHRRKVRCTGGQPCRNCGNATLHCTYLAIPQKKGPKGHRAKVISEIRDTQQKSPTRNGTPPGQAQSPTSFASSPRSPPHARSATLLPRKTIDGCINFFFAHLYPTMPIFSKHKLFELIDSQLESSPEVFCLAASICAFILVQPGLKLPGTPGGEEALPEKRYGYAKAVLKEVERVRKFIDYIDDLNVRSVQTSFFLFCSYFGLENQNRGWFHMREATTLAQIIKMHEESSYATGDAHDNAYSRRLYWLLLVTERAYGMERHHPLNLYPTIELPKADGDAGDAAIISGFLHLIALFRLIDDDFIGLWNKARTECSVDWLSQLHSQLRSALPPKMYTTESQEADIRVTQQWLRTMTWQLSIAYGSLSSGSEDSSLTFRYPIEIAADLVRDIDGLSPDSMEVHGIGIIEKLFDVACTLTDVIACVPASARKQDSSSIDPTEHLSHILNLVSRLRGGTSRYLPLLLAKISESDPNRSAQLQHMPLSIKQDRPLSRSDTLSSTSSTIGQQSVQTPNYVMQSFYGTVPPHLAYAEQRGMIPEPYSPTITESGFTPGFSTPQTYSATPGIPGSVPSSSGYDLYTG